MKIALTGGPTAGKTALVETLEMSMAGCIAHVEEAASLLFRSGFPRASDPEHLRIQEKTIYHVQIGLEEIASLDHRTCPLLCDRGTLDGLAYWPDSEASYFQAIGSTMQKELARYDWIVHVDLAAPLDLRPTRFRIENESEILIINERIKFAWRFHPNRLIIPAHLGFVEKIEFAHQALHEILADHPPFAINAGSELRRINEQETTVVSLV